MQADVSRTGGQILVDQLVAQGVERVYCVPGESYLAALDALYDAKIAVTVCRQETGAAIMALTDGRLTGRPGVCFVTRGPGATNAAHGVHIAEHDSAPLVLFVGQVERAMRGRGAFQEMDYRAFFGSTAKWATEVEDPARLPEIVQRAFHTAMQGRPGPVVVALPEDVLTEAASVADAPRVEPAAIWPGQTQMAELQKLLWAAERPVVVFGGGGWNARAGARADAFRRALRPAADRLVPPLERRRQRPSQFRRRARARRQSQAEGAGRGGRSRAADRRPHGRDAVAELHAVRHPRAAPGAGPRPRRRRRDRPRLSSAPRDRRDAAGLLRRAGRPAAAQRDCLGRRDARRARSVPRLDRPAAGQSRRGAARRDHAGAAQARARRDLRQRRRQFRHLAGPLPALPPLQPAARAGFGLDGLRRAGGDRRQARRSRSASRSPSPATATS